MIDDLEYLRVVDPQKYLNRLSRKYGIDVQRLEAVDKDFELIPRGQYGPDDGVVYHKSLEDIATDVGLPLNYVLHLQQIGVISKFPTYADVDFLRRHRLAIADEDGCVKPKRKKRSPAPRVELKAPWMVYAYLRYLRNQIFYNSDGSMVNPGDRIFLKALAREVEFRFGEKISPSMRKEIKEIRVTAYNDKRRAREQDLSFEEVAMQRGIAGDINIDIFQPVTGSSKEIQLTF